MIYFEFLVSGYYINLATLDKRVSGPQPTFGAAKGMEVSSPCPDRDHLPPNYSGCLATLRAMQRVELHSGSSMHPPRRRCSLAAFCFPRWLHTPSLPWSDLRRNQTLEKEKVVRRDIRLPSLPSPFLRSSSLSLSLAPNSFLFFSFSLLYIPDSRKSSSSIRVRVFHSSRRSLWEVK